MHFRSDHFVLAMFSIAIWASPARAEDTAESLFNEGRELLRTGQIAQACDKLAASVQRFAAGDAAKLTVAAMINHADCREQNKQLATAWSMFLATATLAQNHGLLPVATEARKRAGLLQPRLSTLTIVVPDANRIDGLVIERGGEVVEPALWNQGIPLDGGSYVVIAKAPHNAEWSATTELPPEGGKLTVEIPRLKQMRDLAREVSPAADSAPPDETAPIAQAAGGFSILHWSGIGVASVGVLGLAAGVYFGVQARRISDEISDAEAFAPRRFEQGEAAERNSVIALGIGGACVIAGGALFYLGHRSTRIRERGVAVAPIASQSAVGLAAVGRF